MSDEICTLRLFGREHFAIAGAMVDEAVATLGVNPTEAARLRCITEELVAAVILTDEGAPPNWGRGVRILRDSRI